jgi:hypothetical protein
MHRATSAASPTGDQQPPDWLSGVADRPPARRTLRVADAAELRQALHEAQHGDEIVLRPGSWKGVVLEAVVPAPAGRCGAPVVVRGDPHGRTVLTGPGLSFALSGDYLVVSDLVFELQADALIRLGEASRGLRVTNCAFVFHNAHNPVELCGEWIRFDHNYLSGTAGSALLLARAAGGRLDSNYVAAAEAAAAIWADRQAEPRCGSGCPHAAHTANSAEAPHELWRGPDRRIVSGQLVVEHNLWSGWPAERPIALGRHPGMVLRDNSVPEPALATPLGSIGHPPMTRHCDVGPRWLPPAWRVGRRLGAEFTFDGTEPHIADALENTVHRAMRLVHAPAADKRMSPPATVSPEHSAAVPGATVPANAVGNASGGVGSATGAGSDSSGAASLRVGGDSTSLLADRPFALSPAGWGVSGGPDDRALHLAEPLAQHVPAEWDAPCAAQSFTLQGWLRVDEGTLLDRVLLVEQRAEGANGWRLSWQGQRLVLQVWDGSRHYQVSSLDDYALDSQWQFFAVAWEACGETSNVRFYRATSHEPVELAGAATLPLPRVDISGSALQLPGGSPVWIDNLRWFAQRSTQVEAASAASAALTTTELDEVRRGDLDPLR